MKKTTEESRKFINDLLETVNNNLTTLETFVIGLKNKKSYGFVRYQVLTIGAYTIGANEKNRAKLTTTYSPKIFTRVEAKRLEQKLTFKNYKKEDTKCKMVDALDWALNQIEEAKGVKQNLLTALEN